MSLIRFPFMFMWTGTALQRQVFIPLLACCLLHAVSASKQANSTNDKVEDDRREGDRIVGGSKETDGIVSQWQALFVKNGSFSGLIWHLAQMRLS